MRIYLLLFASASLLFTGCSSRPYATPKQKVEKIDDSAILEYERLKTEESEIAQMRKEAQYALSNSFSAIQKNTNNVPSEYGDEARFNMVLNSYNKSSE